jgi:ubiquinone/menaquinone biosynthesis C-methylase UbiE
LEIGCGDGMWTRMLQKNCDHLVSMDLSKTRIEMARETVTTVNVHFILSDARVLPFKDGVFTTVCAFEVIEHLPHYEDHLTFLHEVKRVLSTNGVFLISTPNRPLFKIYCTLLKENHPTHFSELNYFQFNSILKTCFPVVKIYGRFGWLSPLYKFYIIRKTHILLSRVTPLCKGLFGICRKTIL